MNNARNFTIYRGVDFGPVVLTCTDSAGNVANVTDFSAFAEMRSGTCGAVTLNFAPTVSNGAAGEVTIPAVSAANTANLPGGRYGWDLVLANATGFRTGPYHLGAVVVADLHTQL
jgi:hypothetical protein